MSEQDGNTRSRTVTWKDPRQGASAARKLAGLDYLRAIQRGELPGPPIAELMGFSPVEVEEGRVVFAVKPGEYHYNPIGTVHGGLAATLLDSALGCCIHTMLPAGVGYTTLELHVNYIRGISDDSGPLRCIGEVIHVGSRVATSQGRLVDEKGNLYAHGTTTCMIFRPPGSGGGKE